MKILLPSLMLALILITSIGRATIPKEATMKLSSPDFSDGGNIPNALLVRARNDPTLTIDGVPKEAKSLVLIVDDPDAPGGNFTHWLMWNIVPRFNRDRGKQASGSRSARSERRLGENVPLDCGIGLSIPNARDDRGGGLSDWTINNCKTIALCQLITGPMHTRSPCCRSRSNSTNPVFCAQASTHAQRWPLL